MPDDRRIATLVAFVYRASCSADGLCGVPAVGGSLRFAQEVDRHRCPEKGIVFGERIGTDPMLLLWTESVHNISQRPFR